MAGYVTVFMAQGWCVKNFDCVKLLVVGKFKLPLID